MMLIRSDSKSEKARSSPALTAGHAEPAWPLHDSDTICR